MNTPQSAQLCKLLGCRCPIVSAGMGGPARSELVSGITAAGGFGFLGMVREPTDLIVREINAVRAEGHQHFGVNLIPASTPPALLDDQIRICIELSVPVVGMFWDIDPQIVASLKQHGILVSWQVGSVDEAIAAERAGVDLIIAQGREAGGHVRGTEKLGVLLPQVVNAVSRPVLAAGGLTSGGDLLTALAMGAGGMVAGTAFLATKESYAHEFHKRRLIEAEASATVLTNAFHINWPGNAPVRVLKSDLTRDHQVEMVKVVIAMDDERPIYRYSTDSPLRTTYGSLDQMALYAGTGVGRLREIVSVGERLQAILDEAEALLDINLLETETRSPVCYLGEVIPQAASVEYDPGATLRAIVALLRELLHASVQNRPDTLATGEVPFDTDAVDYARWALLLGGDKAFRGWAGVAERPLNTIGAEALTRVGSLIARMPPNALRGQLVLLQDILNAQQVRYSCHGRS